MSNAASVRRCGRPVGGAGWFDGYCQLPVGHKGDCDEREPERATQPQPSFFELARELRRFSDAD